MKNDLNIKDMKIALLEEKFFILASEFDRLANEDKSNEIIDLFDKNGQKHVENKKKSPINDVELMKKKMNNILEDLEQNKVLNIFYFLKKNLF